MTYQLPAYSPLSLSSLVKSLGALVSLGSRSREVLASHLKTRFSCPEAILTGSGTEALQLAFQSIARRGEGDAEILLPAYSCYDLMTAVLGAGVRARFYDLDPTSFMPDEGSFRRGLRPKPAAVVVGNLFGYPLDWDAIRSWVGDEGPPLIEDAAQGVGSSWSGRPTGTFGDLTILSFGRGKGWTGGGGGALLVRNPDILDLPGSLLDPSWTAGPRSAVLSAAQWILGRPSLYGLPNLVPGLGLGETHFKEPSSPKRISAFSGGLAFRTASIAEDERHPRAANAERLFELLAEGNATGRLRTFDVIPGGESSFLRFPILWPKGPVKESVGPEFRRLGIAASYPRVLHELPGFLDTNSAPPAATPGALRLSRHLLTLPTHSRLSPGVYEAIRELLLS